MIKIWVHHILKYAGSVQAGPSTSQPLLGMPPAQLPAAPQR